VKKASFKGFPDDKYSNRLYDKTAYQNKQSISWLQILLNCLPGIEPWWNLFCP